MYLSLSLSLYVYIYIYIYICVYIYIYICICWAPGAEETAGAGLRLVPLWASSPLQLEP